MAKKYLDYDGLLYFWQKIKTTFAQKTHSHTKSEITDFPTTMTPSSHTHGNIQNGGTLQTTDVGVANGDKLVITDASGSNKIARSSVAFDGSTENKALTPKGTWKEFNNYVHPTTTAQSASAKKVGNDANGHVVLGDALKTSDLTNDSGFITIEDVPAGVQPTTTSPKMDGTASVGTETKYAKGDHVHPSDTSRVPTTRKINGKALSEDITLMAGDIYTAENGGNLGKDVETLLYLKVDKEIGKGLSSNDFTDEYRSKLSNIREFANVKGTANRQTPASSSSKIISVDLDVYDSFSASNYSNVTVYSKDMMDIWMSSAQDLFDGKVDKVEGKGLSTNDYTTEEKEKLAGIKTGANTILNVAGVTDPVEGYYINGTYDKDGATSSVGWYDANCINGFFANATSQMGTALNGKVDKTSVGQASGVCPLDANSKVDAQYLPSYVDDVIEAYARSGQTALSQNWLATGSATGTVITPETGKIYVLMADSGDYTANTQFRWSGTTYVKMADGGVSSITNAEIDTILAS